MGGRFIVCTSINPVTEAVRRFDEMSDWTLIVVGDLKSPRSYVLRNGVYLSPEDQVKIDPQLSDLIGWNCIQRRNMGLLLAGRERPDVVALVDDDNLPLPGWGTNLMVGREVEVNWYEEQAPAFDPLSISEYPHLWHRGYPLQLVADRHPVPAGTKRIKVDVQADLWQGDPDVDAVCRMIYRPECRFSGKQYPAACARPMPFNSQNTFIAGSWLRHYFVFPHIGRMDDIWAAYYLQALGARVVVGPPSVRQDRNPHDSYTDMRMERLGYERNLALLAELQEGADRLMNFLPRRSVAAFHRYQSLLPKEE